MNTITENEMELVLKIFKNPTKSYTANSIASEIGITPMGALKITKKLEKEGIINRKELGNAKSLHLNLNNDYVKKYILFVLKREAEQSQAYVKRWIKELKKVKNANAAILYGSILNKGKQARDIDVLLITDENKFSALREEVDKINKFSTKRIHPMYQTEEDFKENIEKVDKPLLSAIKGIVVFGEEVIMRLIK